MAAPWLGLVVVVGVLLVLAEGWLRPWFVQHPEYRRLLWSGFGVVSWTIALGRMLFGQGPVHLDYVVMYGGLLGLGGWGLLATFRWPSLAGTPLDWLAWSCLRGVIFADVFARVLLPRGDSPWGHLGYAVGAVVMMFMLHMFKVLDVPPARPVSPTS